MTRLMSLAAFAPLLTGQVQIATFFSDVDDTDQPYALYVPRNYDPASKYPLVISLHGADSNHRLNMRRVFGRGNLPGETDAEATRYFPQFREAPYFVASPLARGTMGYQDIAEKDVYDVLADVKRRYHIDGDRIYLTGLSMGGGGALWLGLTRPDMWAAVAPVCAAAPAESRELAVNALHTPVMLFHGSIDPVVPVQSSRQWQHEFLELSCPVEYTEYPNVRHNSWDSAYRNGSIFNVFDRHRRDRFPDRVRFRTLHYKYRSAWWIEIDGITPGTPAEIDARFTGPNALSVDTKSLLGFTLNLTGHPNYAAKRPLTAIIDGEKLRPTMKASFVKAPKGWRPGRYTPPPGSKRPGSEGPIGEAVASRHMYVYGTERQAAFEASDWSTPHSKLQLSFRVEQDKDVRPGDLRDSNLVLFGNKETNQLIAHYAAQLPMALNPSAADYGLLYIYPMNGRYLLINSGLPFWTGAEDAHKPEWGFYPPKYGTLRTFGDFILFKGSLENVIAEGLFTPEWKLPPDAAAKMKATGAIEVQ